MSRRQLLFSCAFVLSVTIAGTLQTSHGQAQTGNIVLYASETQLKVGNWTKISDASAAGGFSLMNTDAGLPKVNTPALYPSNYFELSFIAEAGRPYRLWIRGKAQNDSPYNDSVYAQFSSSVNAQGAAIYRIGTASATTINLEEWLNVGVQGWGWQDNGWGIGQLGSEIYFQSTGEQKIRIQTREDGLSIDQVVLSPSDYLYTSPGTFRNDAVILPASGGTAAAAPPFPSGAPSDVVIWASNVASGSIYGNWTKEYNSTAAGQLVLRHPDLGGSKIGSASASPSNYFDVNFQAVAGYPYRLWMRGRADGDYWGNDSVFVQFAGSVNSGGTAVYRIGTSSGLVVNLEEYLGCGIQSWGWQDTGWGIGVLGPVVYFQTTGTQTLRVQTREDGFAIDQIVLSPSTYLSSSPGTLKNDSVILPSTIGGGPPPNQQPQINVSASPASGTSPLLVTFYSNASDPDGYIASYSWTFGDGSSSSQTNPTKTYQSAGTYTARLTVTDNAGATASAEVLISANSPPPINQAPQVAISASPMSGNPLFVSFSSSASDPDGFITGYSWTFGDGNTSLLPYPTNSYQSAGTYTARLTVTDNAGATASASIVITVNPPPPPPSTTTQLRVLSWNVAFGRGTDNVLNYDRIATWIANLNPDLVALVEIPPYDVASVTGLLGQKTGRTWYSHFVSKYEGCLEGNLILSKYSFTSVSSHYLSYERSVAQATVNVGGTSINFFATHLDHTSSSLRYVQVGELTSWASGFGEPRIVAGDFNAGPDLSEIARMTGSYYDAWAETMSLGTAVAYPDNPIWTHTRTRRGRIDYVFHSRGAASLVLRGTQIPDTRDLANPNVVIALGTLDDKGVRPSDHNIMIADFELR